MAKSSSYDVKVGSTELSLRLLEAGHGKDVAAHVRAREMLFVSLDSKKHTDFLSRAASRGSE